MMTVYKDLKQPIGLRMEAAKAALPYEKPRPASIENKVVNEFENMSNEEIETWLDERAETRVKMRQRRLGQPPRLRSIRGGRGGIGGGSDDAA